MACAPSVGIPLLGCCGTVTGQGFVIVKGTHPWYGFLQTHTTAGFPSVDFGSRYLTARLECRNYVRDPYPAGPGYKQIESANLTLTLDKFSNVVTEVFEVVNSDVAPFRTTPVYFDWPGAAGIGSPTVSESADAAHYLREWENPIGSPTFYGTQELILSNQHTLGQYQGLLTALLDTIDLPNVPYPGVNLWKNISVAYTAAGAIVQTESTGPVMPQTSNCFSGVTYYMSGFSPSPNGIVSELFPVAGATSAAFKGKFGGTGQHCLYERTVVPGPTLAYRNIIGGRGAGTSGFNFQAFTHSREDCGGPVTCTQLDLTGEIILPFAGWGSAKTVRQSCTCAP